MDPLFLGVLGIVFLLVLLIIRVPVAFSMILVAFIGMASFMGLKQAVATVGSTSYHSVSNWLFLVIPMFILMGEFAAESGIISDLFSFFKAWFGRIRGSLGVVTIFTSVVFAFATGSTMAATAVMGKAALPEMSQAKYDRKLSLSTILAGGTLGNMIPPSIGLTLYAILTEESIGKMLIAGIIPGLLMAALFIGQIYFTILRNPGAAPLATSAPWREKWRTLKKTWAMMLVVGLVIGAIYTGVVTITEAATVGAFATFVIGLSLRRLNLRKVHDCLMNTMLLTAMIFFLLFSVALFTRFLAFTGFTRMLTEITIASGVSPLLLLLVLTVVYFILGCIMDATSMMLLVVPVVYPIITALGIDPIWFGVYTVAMIQIGGITPPVGMTVYVLKGVSGNRLEDCFSAAIPVVIAWLIGLAILAIWPEIVLWLPGKM